MKHYSEQDDLTHTEINLTPLIDMVFILLIFFLVTSSFVKESGIEVNRPSAATAERQERGHIIISVRKNGEFWVDKRRVDAGALRAQIERLHADNPEGSVIIAADKAAQTGDLVTALDQARLAGVTNVAIAATP
ncbi:MAG: biopolymer transporter ExbD [Methylococcales bacterium]|nr:biopolymer transporter ExbD [Methylococcales bacterium]